MSSDALKTLADAVGVATEFWDWQGRHVEVSEQTITAVLAAMDLDATDPQGSLDALEERRWARTLPPVCVATQGQTARVDVHLPHGSPVRLEIVREDGQVIGPLRQLENWEAPRTVAGRLTGEASFEIPADLPPGYHELRATIDGEDEVASIVVAPARLDLPDRLGSRRVWGLATQIYSVLSEGSWGVGDLTDLADLATWSASEHGADFVLVNPLHAAEPCAPMEPSPYLPTTRQWFNPLYLRVEAVPEYAGLSERARDEVVQLREELQAKLASSDFIDRDAAWAAKRAALAVLHEVPRRPARELSYQAFLRRHGRVLRDFATWCVLADELGTDPSGWGPGLADPDSDTVAAFRDAHRVEVDRYCWMQWLLDEQLDAAQRDARRAGMALGIMNDLAVGVNPLGAEVWAQREVFARGVSVGAPPDAFSQKGQDWSQPPWRPDLLREAAYGPFRAVVRAALQHAGALRVDHVMGLFRLWWVPPGLNADQGTYVRYDHEAMVGILLLEAHRAGAVVVGEDVGVVEPWVRDYLASRGVFGTSILWFERDYSGDGSPLAPERWREQCLGSVTTHDLPPTLGYLAGDHVRLRDETGVLTRPLDDELAAHAADVGSWLQALRDRGLLSEAGDTEEAVVALHEYLALTPSRLRAVALVDAVGDRRTQNLPGTYREYPNWRVPLSGPDGAVLRLEEVFTSPRVAEVVAALDGTGSVPDRPPTGPRPGTGDPVADKP